MSEKPRTVRRNVYVFGTTSFLNDTASETAYWILPAFVASLGGTPAHLGVIEGIAEGVASFGKLVSGYLTDRFVRRKPMVVAGYAIANVAKPLLAFATAWWHILFIRFADRAAKGIRNSPRDVMLAESVEKQNLGSAYGLLQAMDSAGAIAGPLLALALVAHFDLRTVFLWAAVPGLISIAVVALLARETGAPKAAASAGFTLGLGSLRQLPARFYWVLAAVGLFSVGNSSDMFLVLRAQESGIAVEQAPLLGLVFNMMYTAWSWPAGKLSDRFSKRVIAAAGYLVFAAVYFVFAAAPTVTALWISMAFYGLFYALTQPVLKALIAEALPAELRGRGFGIYHFVSSIAVLLASLITGALWEQYGAELPFYLSSGLAVSAAGMLLVGRFASPATR